MADLQALFRHTVDLNCSDLHFQAGERPRVRLQGELVEIEDQPVFTAGELEPLLLEFLEAGERQRLGEQGFLDFSRPDAGGTQWRCHYYHQRTGLAAAFRALAPRVPTLEELHLPPQLERFAHLRSGLVLVTGATGCGKSTTLAALIDLISATYRKNIITIEDPIEYVHNNRLSVVQQRCVGVDVPSFHAGVVDSLQEDPDVIVVGELRDNETVRAALTAAETGILVFSTLHSNDAAQTVDRLLDLFGDDERQLARVMLSHSLKGVVSQVLLQERTGKGRVPACEVMFLTSAIAGLIRMDRIHEIRNCIQTGRSAGMCLLDDSLEALVAERRVTPEEAVRYAQERRRFRGAPVRGEWFLGGPRPKEPPPADRRHEPRVKGLNLVSLEEFDEQIGQPTELTLGRTLDLSHDGVKVQLNHPVLLGSRVELQLALENAVLDVHAEVRALQQRDDGTYAVGLRFRDLSLENGKLLDHYLRIHG